MAKSTTVTSFRLTDDARKYLDILGPLFRESNTETMERALKLLYEQRESALKADMEERLAKSNETGLID